MNERIRALAEQADAYSDAMDIGGKNYIGLRDEYFAELIVRNCVNELVTQMWHHGIDQSNNPSFYKAIEKTIEQFGIKE